MDRRLAAFSQAAIGCLYWRGFLLFIHARPCWLMASLPLGNHWILPSVLKHDPKHGRWARVYQSARLTRSKGPELSAASPCETEWIQPVGTGMRSPRRGQMIAGGPGCRMPWGAREEYWHCDRVGIGYLRLTSNWSSILG